jgi:hypothetical protein
MPLVETFGGKRVSGPLKASTPSKAVVVDDANVPVTEVALVQPFRDDTPGALPRGRAAARRSCGRPRSRSTPRVARLEVPGGRRAMYV